MSADAGMTSSTTRTATQSMSADGITSSPARPATVQQQPSQSGGTNGHGSAVKIRGSPSKYVKLNVGGALHYTTIDTLTKQDNMLRAMFSGRMEVLTDSEGWILIDRSGRHFGTILNFLRDGKVTLPETKLDLEDLHAEAKYYLVQELVEKCQKALRWKKDEYTRVCRIPVITSQQQAQSLISATSKPIVKLLYNRQNNKYSYTSNSDDNILKNIEMFDKLSVRFSRRIMFIKDIRSSNEEICCWTFYGRGHKVAEISCTSIVYLSEKKQTKVEFPEARVLEETLNVLLHEKVDSTEEDFHLSLGAAAPTSGSQSEDEEEASPRPR